MSTFDNYIGREVVLGEHLFTADDIITFALKYDPQPFHTDPEAARNSLFGGLCASGWHTTAVFMQLNVEFIKSVIKECIRNGETPPTFGPSPGIENLSWIKPVFAGDRLTYFQKVVSVRPLTSRPGWSMIAMTPHAINQHGEDVLRFDSAAMIRLPA